MHPIEACVRNPVKVSVGVLIVTLFGLISLFRMPMQLTPEIQTPTITVKTRWPGASPQEIERAIVKEQEDQLKSVEGLRKMSSESEDSRGTVKMEFVVGTDMSEALIKVSSRLQQVPEYPEDADEPIIAMSDAADRAIAWFILSQRMPTRGDIAKFQQELPHLSNALEPARRAHNSGLSVLRLRRIAEAHPEIAARLPAENIDVPKLRKFAQDFIESRFERCQGVSTSNVFGGQDPELRVEVDPQKLAARNLTITDLRQALREENVDTSAGDFYEGKRRWVVRTRGQFQDPQQVADHVLVADKNGPIYVRDVAEVRLDFKKPESSVRRFGTSNIAINCLRETGANVLEVMRLLRQATRELNAGILKENGLQLTQVYDETDYIHAAVGLVKWNIFIGGVLTVAVLLLFLRSVRPTLIVTLAIPTSIIGTFLLLNGLGRSLNVISLAGLAFAVGMLVDNAVVVLENIYRHYQTQEPTFKVAVNATQEVWGAVVASTLTTLAVFLPVVLVKEEAGQLFLDIALAISCAVGLSLLVSVTVIPTASARLFSRPRHGRVSRKPGTVERIAQRFVAAVITFLRYFQQGFVRQLALVAVFIITSLITIVFFLPKVEYLPTGNRNLAIGVILPPPGYNLEEMMRMGAYVEEKLAPYWDLNPESDEARALDFPAIGDWFYVTRGRQVFMGLRAYNPTESWRLVQLLWTLNGIFDDGTRIISFQSSLFEQGLGAGRTVDIEVSGPELVHLVKLGRQIMKDVPDVFPPEFRLQVQVRPVPSLDLSNPEVHVKPKGEQAVTLGIRAADLGYTVDALVDGAYVTDFFQGGDKIDLAIVGKHSFVQHTQDIEALQIATPTGQLVTLGTIADVSLSSGPEQINRRERERTITIQVTPPEQIPLQEAIERIDAEILEPLEAGGELSGGYRIHLSGTVDKLRATWSALFWNILLALAITYLLMAALFESWLYPLAIIFSVLLGAVGGLIGLRLLNVYLALQGVPPQSLDVLTMLGFVILIGTSVNNAILIVHQALNYSRNHGWDSRKAVLESVRVRIRPIFMTMTTTVLGLCPLVLFPGAGSELYRGLGSVVLGGLFLSTFFTLLLVPILFTLLLDVKAKLHSLLHRLRPADSGF
jgi:HAE1 family hydrophobic/amphiphilic exporter-1